MYQAEISKKQNLLKISYSRHVTEEETKRWSEDLKLMLAELQSGFRLLTDLTALESMDLACIRHLKAAMNLCNRKGVSLVVRVIPDPQKDIGLNILSLFHYSRGVHIVTCGTMLEAQQVLRVDARDMGIPVSDRTVS